MPGPDERDESLKRSTGDSPTTPYRTPSAGGEATLEFDPAGTTAKALGARYDLLAELGRGGMGAVYKARDRESGDVVALKVLLPEIAARADIVERFKAELLLARKVTHKNVCRVYDINRFGDVAAISMEYIDGESLRAVLDRFGGVPLRRGLEWVRQICSGLTEAHTQGVVHRDLKPENILVARDGTVKVMDFGIARSAQSNLTGTGSLIGTPRYMSPEQAEGKPADPRSDLYSLGLVMYEMFTGRQPFQSETAVGYATKHLQETPPPPRAVEPLLPAFLALAIEKCLEKKPKKRFQSAADLTAALEPQQPAEPELTAAPAAATPEPAELPLPPHLAAWRRSDYLVLAGGLVGLVVFFLLFPLVFPYASMRIEISREQAEARTRAILQKYAPTLAESELVTRYAWELGPGYWGDAVLAWGLPGARQAFREEADSWMEIPRRVRREGFFPVARFYAEGDLRQFDVRPDVGTGAPLPLEAVLSRAMEAAEDLFRVKLAGQVPLPYVYDARRSGWATPDGKNIVHNSDTPAEWILPVGPERERKVTLFFSNRGDLVGAGQRLLENGRPLGRPPTDRVRSRRWVQGFVWSLLGIVIWVLLCLLLFIHRRLFVSTAPVALALSLVVWAGLVECFWVIWRGEAYFWFLLPIVGVTVLVIAYGAVSPGVYYVSRRWPGQFATLARLVRERLRARPVGLALLRGTALGLAFLGAHSAILWLAGTLKLAAASEFWFFPFAEFVNSALSASADSIAVLSAAALQIPATLSALTLISVGLPLALLRGATARAPLLLGAMAALWTLVASPLAGAGAFPVIPLYLFAAFQGLFFAWVFLHFDMLACLMAVFTVETGLVSYAVYSVFGAAEPWSFIWGLLLWVVVVLFGAVIWLRPQLGAARRRLATVFE